MNAKVEASTWRTHIQFDRDGRPYLHLEGAALYLEMGEKTLSNRLYESTGPKVVKKNGRLRFYVDDLKAYDKGMETVHQTNWYKVRKSA